MLEKREFDKSDFLWRLSTTITVVAGLFSVLVFLLIMINYGMIKRADPVNHELLTQMRLEYANAPEKDEALAQRIRDLDLLTRKAFFTSQEFLHLGAFVLLGSVSIFLVAFKNMMRWQPKLPELGEVPTAEKEFLAYAQSRQLITWAAVGLLAGGMMTAYFTESALTTELLATPEEGGAAAASGGGGAATGGEATEAVAAAPAPTWEEMEVNWPSLRGPGSMGVAHFTNAPTTWDLEGGSNVRWQVDLEMAGKNSPVIWGDHLYFSSADEETREVLCFNTENGDLLWKKALESLPGSPPAGELEVMDDTGYAPATMVVHGNVACALFPNGDVYALDNEGNQKWGVSLGLPDNHYGYSSSLLAYGSHLLIQYDQSSNGKLIALDINTGKEAWVAARDEISWASPILARTPMGPQVVLASESKAEGYNPENGTQLWSVECLGGEVAPSPAYANGMIFVGNEYARSAGLALEGTADAVTATEVWEYDNLLPEVASPVGDGERFYFGTGVGDIVCLDAKSGEELWVQETEDGFYSSPILVGDHLFFGDLSGNMYVVRASGTFEEIARFTVADEILATPAFMDGRVYVRTPEKLYCIEAS